MLLIIIVYMNLFFFWSPSCEISTTITSYYIPPTGTTCLWLSIRLYYGGQTLGCAPQCCVIGVQYPKIWQNRTLCQQSALGSKANNDDPCGECYVRTSVMVKSIELESQATWFQIPAPPLATNKWCSSNLTNLLALFSTCVNSPYFIQCFFQD